MAKKTAKSEAAASVESVSVSITAPAAAFIPCHQCGNPGDCARAAKCTKGFK